MGLKNILLIVLIFLLSSTAVAAEGNAIWSLISKFTGEEAEARDQIMVTIDPTNPKCRDENGNHIANSAHICQLYDGGTEEKQKRAVEKCIERSKFRDIVPDECIETEIEGSNFAGVDASDASVEALEKDLKGKTFLISYNGKVVVSRGIKNLPVESGMELLIDDIVKTDLDSSAYIHLFDGNKIRIGEKQSYMVGDGVPEQKPSLSRVGTWWQNFKNFFKGEEYEIKSPTAVAGVRG